MNIPCVIFQTHHSEVIKKEKSKLFTKELHPNFCPGSDHGESIEKVVDQLSKYEHNGIVIRAHKYNMPIEALKIYSENGFKFSMNNYTDMKYRVPYMIYDGVCELNTFFEDGLYLKNEYPLDANFLIQKMINDGIYVFNIHPIHLAFNSWQYSLTRNFKDNMSKDEYRSINNEFIEIYKYRGYGIRNYLMDIIVQMKKSKFEFISINEVEI